HGTVEVVTVLTHDTDRRVRPCPEPGCRRPLLRQWRPVPSVEPGSISRNTDPTGRETGSSSRCGRNRRRSPCPPGNGGGRKGARERMSLVAHDVTIASKTRRSMPQFDPERGGGETAATHPQENFFSVEIGGKPRRETVGKTTRRPLIPVSSLVTELHACRSQAVDECGRRRHRVWNDVTTLV